MLQHALSHVQTRVSETGAICYDDYTARVAQAVLEDGCQRTTTTDIDARRLSSPT